MESKQCRFCSVAPNKQNPKLNSLTSQLIQYHYADDFYFYFARSINDLLRSGSNPDKIMLMETRVQCSRPRLGMAMYSGKKAKELVKKLSKVKEEGRKFQPCIANLDAWKFMKNRNNKEKGQSTLHAESRRKRMAGRLPLRQGSLLGPLLPQPGQPTQFADPSSFSTTLHDIYNPTYSSDEERLLATNRTARKGSVYLERVYDKLPKNKVPLLDIKKLISTQKTQAADTDNGEGDMPSGTSRVGVTGTNFLFRPSSISAVKNITTASKLQLSGPSISALEASRSKGKNNSIKVKAKGGRKPKEKLGLRLDLRGVNILEKRRGGSTGSNGTFNGMASSIKLKGINTIKNGRIDLTENRHSAAEINGLLSSRTGTSKAKTSYFNIQTAHKDSSKKVLMDHFTSPKTRMASHKSFKSGLGLSITSRPTMQLVKDQLAKLSGKESLTLMRDKKHILTAEPCFLRSRIPHEVQLSPKSKRSQERQAQTQRTIPHHSYHSMDIPNIIKTIKEQRTRDKSRNCPSTEKRGSTAGSNERDRDKSKSKSKSKSHRKTSESKPKAKKTKELLKNIELFARHPSRKTIKFKSSKCN